MAKNTESAVIQKLGVELVNAVIQKAYAEAELSELREQQTTQRAEEGPIEGTVV